jgi:Chain length determinant protein
MNDSANISGWQQDENQFMMGNYLRGLLRRTVRIFIHWRTLLLAGVLGAVIGLGYAFFSPPLYQAKVNFVIEENKQSAGGLFSALAGQMGMDLSALSGSSGLLAGDNVLMLLKSPTLLKKVLLTTGPDSTTSLALLYAKAYQKEADYRKLLAPGQSLFPPSVGGAVSMGRLQDSLLDKIGRQLLTKEINVYKPDRKLSFFSLEVTTRHEWLSEQIAIKLIQEASALYILTKTRRLKANVDRLQKKSDSIAMLLNRQTYTTAATNLFNANPGDPGTAASIDITAREKSLLSIIYADLNKSLELTRTALIQETPTIEIVDRPVFPLKRIYTRPIVAALLGLLVGSMLAATLIFFRTGTEASGLH